MKGYDGFITIEDLPQWLKESGLGVMQAAVHWAWEGRVLPRCLVLLAPGSEACVGNILLTLELPMGGWLVHLHCDEEYYLDALLSFPGRWFNG